MNLGRDSCELLELDITADIDLTAAGVEVKVGTGTYGVWQWTGPATSTGTGANQRWTRTCRRLVAGPDADDTGEALVLPLGRQRTRWRLTGLSPEKPSRPGNLIDVD